MARALERLGVDVVEAGFPAASPGDFEAVRAVARGCSSTRQPRGSALSLPRRRYRARLAEAVAVAAHAPACTRSSRRARYTGNTSSGTDRAGCDRSGFATGVGRARERCDGRRVLGRGRIADRVGLPGRGRRGRDRLRRIDDQHPGHGRSTRCRTSSRRCSGTCAREVAGAVDRIDPERPLSRRPGPCRCQQSRRRARRSAAGGGDDMRYRRTCRQRRARGGGDGRARARPELGVSNRPSAAEHLLRHGAAVWPRLPANRPRATRPSSAVMRSPTRPASTSMACSPTAKPTRSSGAEEVGQRSAHGAGQALGPARVPHDASKALGLEIAEDAGLDEMVRSLQGARRPQTRQWTTTIFEALVLGLRPRPERAPGHLSHLHTSAGTGAVASAAVTVRHEDGREVSEAAVGDGPDRCELPRAGPGHGLSRRAAGVISVRSVTDGRGRSGVGHGALRRSTSRERARTGCEHGYRRGERARVHVDAINRSRGLSSSRTRAPMNGRR